MSVEPGTIDPIERFLDLIEQTRLEDIPAPALEAGRVFFLDTAGVALAGRLAPKLDDLLAAARLWAPQGRQAEGAVIWNTGLRTAAPVAALINGYQCHALEYDCVYEPGVVLPAPPIFAALMTHASTLAAAGRAPSGADLLRAFIVAVEVSCTLGAATRGNMIFFRPSTTGVFSALAAIACIDPLPREQLRYAFGIAYSQMCGPMQAHEEGSMMLAMQMGFAARNAQQAFDMARFGITAPAHLLMGRFGFFQNFEREHDLAAVLPGLGRDWKIAQMSHKPFPSGRVTHGLVYALRQLRETHGITPGNALQRVRRIQVTLPPLGKRLVGRPMVHHPAPNYARLCMPFVAAAELLRNRVDPSTFTPEVLQDEALETLALRVHTMEVAHANPNAFYPQHLTLELNDGQRVEQPIPHAWGHPAQPMDAAAREDKFSLCWALARPDGGATAGQALIEWLRSVDQRPDCTPLLDSLAAA